ncbi:MAG: thioredoxin domain-containing protein [Gudongella sp.]|nr:thioredoxin domain-containing protein [Gudongella sp.]
MLELTKENFEAEVLKAEGTVLVDFWSPSCEPCKALMPKVHEFEEKYSDKVKFASLDITQARRVAIGQKVLGLPVVAIYKNGERVDSVVGDEATSKSVGELIEKHC